MESVTSTWFECVVKYERTTEEGTGKKVTETYVVEALSFTEAEAKIIKEIEPFTSGEFEIKKISPMTISEIFFSENDTDDSWFKCKLTFIVIDEKTCKEKRSSVSYLIQANSLKTALNCVNNFMDTTMTDYVTSNIGETKIMDVFR